VDCKGGQVESFKRVDMHAAHVALQCVDLEAEPEHGDERSPVVSEDVRDDAAKADVAKGIVEDEGECLRRDVRALQESEVATFALCVMMYLEAGESDDGEASGSAALVEVMQVDEPRELFVRRGCVVDGPMDPLNLLGCGPAPSHPLDKRRQRV
jgi:hypothetical protein